METDIDNKKRIRTIRRSNAGAGISLLYRRAWYAEGENETPPTAPPATATTGTGTDANIGASNTDENTSPFLKITQKDLEGMLSDRGGQAKRNALSDLASTLKLEDVNELTAIVESHKQAEEKRKQAEEANKSELTKKQDELDASKALQATQAADINKLLIEHAFMRLAPGKEIPADRFADFLVLMDTSTITVVDGKVNDSEVTAAIDATLEGRDYLKANASNGRGHGSPPRNPASPKLPTPSDKQPVQRRRKTSM